MPIPKINYNLKNFVILLIFWLLKFNLECILVAYNDKTTIIKSAIFCDDKIIDTYTF